MNEWKRFNTLLGLLLLCNVTFIIVDILFPLRDFYGINYDLRFLCKLFISEFWIFSYYFLYKKINRILIYRFIVSSLLWISVYYLFSYLFYYGTKWFIVWILPVIAVLLIIFIACVSDLENLGISEFYIFKLKYTVIEILYNLIFVSGILLSAILFEAIIYFLGKLIYKKVKKCLMQKE